MSHKHIGRPRERQTIIDLKGQRFGRYTVLRRSEFKHYWLCRCDCGTERDVRQDSLRNGGSMSCGCLAGDIQATRLTTHSLSRTPEYQVWKNILWRCTDPKNKSYADYGARGITVCERWTNSVEAFIEDMGPRPSPRHSIDRIDNEKGYGPDNCRWATRREQARNKRSSRLLTHDGRTMTMADWSDETGINYHTIKRRLQAGWNVEKALTTP